jgi:2-alkyl-3-oxoalkanoate reductase
MLERARPDVVHVLTPPASHRAIVESLLHAGRHVLVEKPMAIDAAECRSMVDAARRSGKQLGVCHNYLFVDALVSACSLVDRGALGTVIGADLFWRMSTFRPDLRGAAVGWMRGLPGGPFLEVLPHLVYVVRRIMGQPVLRSVVASGRLDGAHDSELRALLSSPSGPIVLAISLNAAPVQKILRVHGTRESLSVDLGTSTLLRLRSRMDTDMRRALVNLDMAAQLVAGLAGNAWKASTGRLARGHQRLVQAFYDSLESAAPFPASGEDGLAIAEVLDELCGQLPAHAN